ncbi:MAG: carbohydrate porin [Melioribacter sp.]|nr:carbohydrate porin [Melioribacter sp.]
MKNTISISRIILIILAIQFSYLSAPAQSLQPDTLYASLFSSTNSAVHVNSNSGTEEVQAEKSENLFNRQLLSGDWGGIRSFLNETGFNFEFVYKADLFSNLYGGFQRGTKYLDNIDLIFSADLGTSLNWNNTNLTVHFLGNGGGSPCELVGASQGISNIETTPTWKLYQLLLEKKFFDEKFSVAIGLYDLNSEFDMRATSGIFINPSHGIGYDFAKSGLNGPSIFPTTSLAVRWKYQTGNGNYFQSAILDGVPGNPDNPFGTHINLNKNEGFLVATEYGIVELDEEVQKSKIAIGSWIYTSQSEANDIYSVGSQTRLENNYGFYVTAERILYSKFDTPQLGLTGFIRLGVANPNVNPVDFYLGAGFKFSGLLDKESNDALGLAMAFSHNSKKYRNVAEIKGEFIKEYEINFEATYKFQLTPWLMLQPDLQYIINPSYCTNSNSAFVIGSRIEIIF